MKQAKQKPSNLRDRGLTLVELLVALVVTSIILGAVATLAFAIGVANDTAGQTALRQAQLRYATMRIRDIIRHCKLICAAEDNNLRIWLADNNNDNKINIGELVFIDAGENRDHLALYQFPSINTSVLSINDVKSVVPDDYQADYVALLPQCSNVRFLLDSPAPYTRFVSIGFDLDQGNVITSYQITAAARSWAGYLLGPSGQIVSGDDD